MAEDLQTRAWKLYRPPFRYEHGYIFDREGNTVADGGEGGNTALGVVRVRGWGRIGYMPDAEELQDAVGDLIAKALTIYWNERLAHPQPEKGSAMKWMEGKPREDGYYFAVVETASGVRTTVVKVYCSKPRGPLRYLGQPVDEPAKVFPEHDLLPDRIYWEGENFEIASPLFLKFAGPLPEPDPE